MAKDDSRRDRGLGVSEQLFNQKKPPRKLQLYSHDFLGITLLLPSNTLLTNCSAL